MPEAMQFTVRLHLRFVRIQPGQNIFAAQALLSKKKLDKRNLALVQHLVIREWAFEPCIQHRLAVRGDSIGTPQACVYCLNRTFDDAPLFEPSQGRVNRPRAGTPTVRMISQRLNNSVTSLRASAQQAQDNEFCRREFTFICHLSLFSEYIDQLYCVS